MIKAGHHSILATVLRQCWTQRQLFIKLWRRDISERYRGAYLGLFWSLLLPLLSLAVFTVFFGIIFQTRWSSWGATSLLDLALILFVGLALYNFLAECLNRAPSLILAHRNYVKNVIFPLEMLPAVLVAVAAQGLVMSLLTILGLQATVGSGLSWVGCLLPVTILPLLLLTFGISAFLAALGVYVRDIQQLVVPVVQLLMFMSPIFYPTSALPDTLRIFMQYNPLAITIEQTRGVILFATVPHWASYFMSLAIAICSAVLGLYWFARTRKGFADVL